MNNSIKEYFSTTWLERDRSLGQYTYSGWALIDKIADDEHVLDVGCGTNQFKDKIKYLYGIDITDVGADEVVSIEDFETDIIFDVAFCLGSINFGPGLVVYNQIKKIDSLLSDNGRIYWRCNPGQADHGNEECKNIDFFPWNIDIHKLWSRQFGYKLQNVQKDRKRIYCEWVK